MCSCERTVLDISDTATGEEKTLKTETTMSDQPPRRPKWTELEYLPEWDEEYYHVYTAKKYGKWVMLKTLRPEFKDVSEYRQMLEKEFEVRYNLAHPNIVMINDLEEVPELGMCIITDDVYGKSLKKLIEDDEVDDHILEQVTNQLVQAIEYVQRNHVVHYPITSQRIIFTDHIRNLKVIDVGFDQYNSLSPTAQKDDIYNFGVVLNELLDSYHKERPDLRKVAKKCITNKYRNIEELKLALSNQTSRRLYITIIVFLLIMIGLLLWLIVKTPAV